MMFSKDMTVGIDTSSHFTVLSVTTSQVLHVFSAGNSHYHSDQGWSLGNNVEYDTIHYGVAWNDKRSHGNSR